MSRVQLALAAVRRLGLWLRSRHDKIARQSFAAPKEGLLVPRGHKSFWLLAAASATMVWGLPWATGGSPAGAQAGPTCQLPVAYNPYQGYRVGVPDGWEALDLGGTITVTKDRSGTEGAMIYPAAMTPGMTPASFFGSYLRYEQQQLAKQGITLSFKAQPDAGGLPLAAISLRAGGALLAGYARALLLPVRTHFGSQEVVFSSWWAPPSRWAADSADLIGISRCYAAAPAHPFLVARDQAFTYLLPAGWRVLDEHQDNIDLQQVNGNATVSYLFYGIPAQYNTPQLALSHIFQVEGVTITQILSQTTLPDQQLSSGGTQAQEYVEYLGRYQHKAIHGLVYILTDSGNGVPTFGVMRAGGSTVQIWNSVNGGLIEMMGAIQHSFVQDLQEIERLDRQWQAESAQEANFDDIINGYQLAQDPSTGQPYLVPDGDYGQCSDGSFGYCGPNGQALTPISH